MGAATGDARIEDFPGRELDLDVVILRRFIDDHENALHHENAIVQSASEPSADREHNCAECAQYYDSLWFAHIRTERGVTVMITEPPRQLGPELNY